MGTMTERVNFWLRHLGPALVMAAALLALDATPLDSVISDWFFDPVTGVLPLRHDVALELLGHQWAKQLVIVVACCGTITHVLPQLRAAGAQAIRPPDAVPVAIALTLAPLAVMLLKTTSARYCPWDLREYGGLAPRLSLLRQRLSGCLRGTVFLAATPSEASPCAPSISRGARSAPGAWRAPACGAAS